MWSKTAAAVPRYSSEVGSSGCGSIRTMAKAVTVDNLNPNMIKLEYAVRGPLVIRANEIKKELEKGASKPFKRVINANIGDAHAMGQKPITFVRQVMTSVIYPALMEKFDTEVQNKAKSILAVCAGNSSGSYTMSCGLDLVRQHVAEYIERRDNQKCDFNNVCLSTGASTAIKHCLELFCNQVNGKPSGIMVPIPQYPLYSATIAEYGLVKVDYYLDEDNNWGLSIPELQRSLCDNSPKCTVRAIVVINPGNPTGQVLTRKNIEDIIKFAHKNSLFIFTDEVYQHNVYAKGSKFYSFKKILCELGPPYKDEVELVSFMTISKGFLGECGTRGGWMELVNLDKGVQAHLYKCISATLCPNVLSQVVVDCLVKPPSCGPSCEMWQKESQAILDSLDQRAKMIAEAFKSMPGFKCNEVQGAMYAFPRIDLPPKAIEAAKAAKKAPDVFYAFKLLEETGICIVAGSGFGQRPGTYHFRTTILPQTPMLKEMLDIFKTFHDKFTKEYS